MGLVAVVKLTSEHWPVDRKPPSNIIAYNKFSKRREAQQKRSDQRGKILYHDPSGIIVLYPRILDHLYWTPEDDTKDRLSLEDVEKVFAHFKSTIKESKPDTVVFDAVIYTPDPESQRRIREHNHQMRLRPAVMPPPAVTFIRQRVPIKVRDLMVPAPTRATTPQEVALLAIVHACHQRLPSDLPGLMGYGIREEEPYNPATLYAIPFSVLPAAPDDPTLPRSAPLRGG
jgi:hypothetical protein